MASFTDSLQPFTPYVDQFPVQPALQVGLQKQAQYNQGIERIQTQIDTIAGMDVVRDVDKQYLQSKLNQLGTDLKGVAAGDFSNFQLTNSVGGMINKIGKDRTVQNAVSSTMRYRKGLTELETAKKEGKSSPSNEWDFMKQASKWLSSPTAGEAFEGSYSPYTNYKKNALEAIKALTKSKTITDDAFTVDGKGNLVIADATVRKELAGISPDQIQKALMATLTPADFKQMEIDGRYTYANADPKRLVESVNSSYTDQISFYNKQKKILEDAKSSTTSNVEKSGLDEKIASLDGIIKKVTSEYSGMKDMILSGDLDGVKAHLHSSNFLNNFSKAFSFTEASQTYQGKTLQEMNMWRADKEQQWKQFITGLEWDKDKFSLTYSQKQRELAQNDKELGGYGGLPMGISQDDLPSVTLKKVVADTENTLKTIEEGDQAFMKQQGKDAEWLETQRLAWQKNPTAVDPKVANHFLTSEDMRRKAQANQVMITDINQQAKEKFGDIRELIPQDAEDYTHVTPSGGFITFTPEDFVNYNSKAKNYIKGKKTDDFMSSVTFGAGALVGDVEYDIEKASKELTPKEFYLFQIHSGAIPETSANKELFKQAQKYHHEVNVPYRKTVDEINKFTAEEVTKRVTVSQGVGYGVPTENEAQKSTISTVLSQFADLAESQKDGLANSPNFNAEDARKIATSNDVTYALTVVEGTEYQPRMYKMNVSGKIEGEVVSTEFRITPEQKTAVFGNMFEASPQVQAFRPYQEQIRKMGGYSTALAPGTSNHMNAYLGKMDFPSVQTYGVRANIEQPSPGKYSIRISAYDPIKKQWFDDISYPRHNLVREDQVAPLLHSLNDAAVYELLNDKAPTAEELKQVKEASKKPL